MKLRKTYYPVWLGPIIVYFCIGDCRLKFLSDIADLLVATRLMKHFQASDALRTSSFSISSRILVS